MSFLSSTTPWLAGVLLSWYVIQMAMRRLAYRRARIQKGCSIPQRYPHKDPFFGIDMFLNIMNGQKNHKLLATIEEHFTKYGKTFESIFLGKLVVNTMDPRVIQTVLALDFDKFGVAPTRKAAVEPFMKDGIFTADGKSWVHSRALVKSIFSGVRISSVTTLEKHVDRLLELVPRNGESIDLQPLLKRMFLDKTTEFLFGECRDSLLHPEMDTATDDFISTFDRVQKGLSARFFLGRFKFFRGRDTKWRQDLARVHAFVDEYVEKALERDKINSPSNAEDGPPVFLDGLVKMTKDRMELRNQMLNIFIPARDSTAAAVSFVFFHLARDERVWNKLRDEIMRLGSTPLTFDSLKSLKYLRFVINESLRLLAPAGLSVRTCLADCVLPYGGGVSGNEPILVQKGTDIRIVFHALHKDPDIWGEDVLEFRPERWETIRTTWEYIPFLGGGRICPAQQMALTEMSYLLVRFLQTFRAMENRDEQLDFVEGYKMTLESRNGVKVGFIQA